jgi:hypothetical protein
MPRESFHEAGITVVAGMLAAHIRIDHVTVDLGSGKDGPGVYFSDIHTLILMSLAMV